MSQITQLAIPNESGASFRADNNVYLQALLTNNSGTAAPSVTSPYMFWADTTTGLLKIRNAANSAWVTVGTMASTNLGLATLASPTFSGNVTLPDGTVWASTGMTAAFTNGLKLTAKSGNGIALDLYGNQPLTDVCGIRFNGGLDVSLWQIGTDLDTGTATKDFCFSSIGVGQALVFNHATLGATFGGPLISPITISAAAATDTNSLLLVGTTTGANYGSITNTGGTLLWGVESSAAPSIFLGSSNYAAVIGTQSSVNFQIATNNNVRVSISNTGGVTFKAYGAGTATFDAMGNITSVSDENIKIAIRPFTGGIERLRPISPSTYKHTEESGFDTIEDYTGYVITDDFIKAFPEAAYTHRKHGMRSLWDRAITAAIHNTVVNHDDRLAALEAAVLH